MYISIDYYPLAMSMTDLIIQFHWRNVIYFEVPIKYWRQEVDNFEYI